MQIILFFIVVIFVYAFIGPLAFWIGCGVILTFVVITFMILARKPKTPMVTFPQVHVQDKPIPEKPKTVLPVGEPLNLKELIDSNPNLVDAIVKYAGVFTPKEFIAHYPTFSVAWSRSREWVDVYACPKGKDKFVRYTFNVKEKRWSYGKNAYGSQEIRKQLYTLFRI